MVDLKQILDEVRSDRELAEREERLGRLSPHPSQCFKPGSEGWKKAKRKELREDRELDDQEIAKKINRALAQKRYYEKNKARLNHKRAKYLRRPKPSYHRAKRKAERRGHVWELTFEEWWNVWATAPRVWNDEKAFKDTAWNLRGSNHSSHTQMVRIDTAKGWTKDNVRIQIPEGKDVYYD